MQETQKNNVASGGTQIDKDTLELTQRIVQQIKKQFELLQKNEEIINPTAIEIYTRTLRNLCVIQKGVIDTAPEENTRENKIDYSKFAERDLKALDSIISKYETGK